MESYLVDRERIELSISGCKPDVFPLALTALKTLVSLVRFELTPPRPKRAMLPGYTIKRLYYKKTTG